MMIISVILIFSVFGFAARCSTLNESKQLISDLLDSYDRRQRPVLDQSQAVVVSCAFILKGIQDFSELDGMLKVRGTLYMEWTDESLVWEVKKYGDIYSFSFPSTELWYPKLLLLNSFDEPHLVGKDWMNIRVSHDGKAVYFGMEMFEVSCDADVTFFPFDTQTCSMVFVASSNTYNEIKLLNKTFAIDNPLVKWTHESKEWILRNVTTQRVHRPRQPDLIATTLVIERLPAFLIVNIFLPVTFLALINVLVFLLPPECGERISFSVTVLLAMAVYMTIVESNLPKISKPMPWICYYLAAVLIQSGLICIATILNLNVYSRANNECIPLCIRSILGKSPAVVQSQKQLEENNEDMVRDTNETTDDKTESNVTWQKISCFVDKICLTTFLLAVITYNTLYFTISLSNAGQSQSNNVNKVLFG